MGARERAEESTHRGMSRRLERAHRILDAAAALILRWGYDKTTIDDIARQAGVAKGTVYLHWKTREDLFRALVLRENLLGIEDLRRRLATDPAGYTLGAILKHSALSLMRRPLLKALLVQDVEVLGKLARDERNATALAAKAASFTAYLELLRARGLVRTDQSLQRQAYLLTVAFLGSFLVAPLLPAELKPSDEELAETVADMVHRALELDQPVAPDALRAASDALATYLSQYEELIREQCRAALAPPPSARPGED